MNLKQGNLENIILNALWNAEENGYEAIDVSNVRARINKNSQKWAYTTIKTVLDRLVDKKLVTRHKYSKKYLYKTVFTRLTLGEEAIKNLARQYFSDNMEDLLKAVEKVCNEEMALVR